LAGKVKTSSREESVSAEIEMDLMVDNEPDVNINITEGNNLPFVSLINKAILNHIKSSIAQFITDLAAKAEGQKNKVEVRDTNALVHKDRERGGKGERERERERDMYVISAKKCIVIRGRSKRESKKAMHNFPLRILPDWLHIDDRFFHLFSDQSEASSPAPSSVTTSKADADSTGAAGQESVAKSHFGGRVQVCEPACPLQK